MAWQDRGPIGTPQAQPAQSGGFDLGGALVSLLPGGSLVNKAFKGEQITAGDVGLEAALSLVPFGLGKVAKGAKALIGGAKAVSAGAKTAGVVGKVAREGTQALGKAWGIAPAAKIIGKAAPLSVKEASRLQRAVIGVGASKTDDALSVFNKVNAAKSNFGNNISQSVKNTLLSPVDMAKTTKGITSGIEQKFSKVLGGDFKTNKVATDIISQVKLAKTPEELWNLRKNIDEQLINWSRTGQSAIPNAEDFARIARTEINSKLKDIVPDFVKNNKTYSDLLTAEQLISGAVRNPKGTSIPLLGKFGGRTVQRGEALLGSALGKVDNIGSSAQKVATSGVGSIIKPLAAQAGTRLAADTLGLRSAPTDQTLESAIMQTQPQLQTQGVQDIQAQTNPLGVSSQQIAGALMKAYAAGDTSAIEQLQGMYELAKSFEPEIAKPLSSEASKTIANANSGLQSLNQLRNIISQQGGEVSKATLLPGRELFGNLGANITGTAEYDTAARNLTDVITRLRTGAALTQQEADFYNSQVPQAFDSPEVIAQKLQVFEDLFNSVASRTGSSSLESALLNQGGL